MVMQANQHTIHTDMYNVVQCLKSMVVGIIYVQNNFVLVTVL